MSHKLSAWNYIRNSKKAVGVLILALSLSLMAMYIVYVLLNITTESFQTLLLERPKKIISGKWNSEVLDVDPEEYPSDEAFQQALQEKKEKVLGEIIATDGIDDAFYTQVLSCRYDAVMGGYSFDFPLVEPERVQPILDHMGARLTEGRLPENDGEIVVDSVIMKNQHWKVGDWFMKRVYGEVFTIVGVLESDNMTCVGTPMGAYNSGRYLIILSDEAHSDYQKLLTDLGCRVREDDVDEDVVTGRKSYNEEVKGVIDSVNSVIFLIVTIFLCISILVAYVSFLRNRMNEYGLYVSIGFSRREVYGMIMREMGIIFGIGILAGTVLSVTGAWLVKVILAEPSGLISKILYPGEMIKIWVAFIMIVGILQIPILLSVNGIKGIDKIEE